MKRQKNPDVLKRFPGGEDEVATETETKPETEGAEESTVQEEETKG